MIYIYCFSIICFQKAGFQKTGFQIYHAKIKGTRYEQLRAKFRVILRAWICVARIMRVILYGLSQRDTPEIRI